MIKELVIKGDAFVNVPADEKTLLELGLDAAEVQAVLAKYYEDVAAVQKKVADAAKKMTGVAFDTVITVKNEKGEDEQKPITVMCSATEADQNGLGVMLTRYLACKLSNKPFTPVNFKFANGNSLVLTADNIDAFQATWEPFRAQFFPVPDVA